MAIASPVGTTAHRKPIERAPAALVLVALVAVLVFVVLTGKTANEVSSTPLTSGANDSRIFQRDRALVGVVVEPDNTVTLLWEAASKAPGIAFPTSVPIFTRMEDETTHEGLRIVPYDLTVVPKSVVFRKDGTCTFNVEEQMYMTEVTRLGTESSPWFRYDMKCAVSFE